MPNRCVAAGCSNYANTSANWEEVVGLFRFPAEPMLTKWKAAIKLKRSDSELSQKSHICSKHFDDDMIDNKIQYLQKMKMGMKPPYLRLRKDAVPRASTNFSSTRPQSPQSGTGSSRATRRIVRSLLSGAAAQSIAGTSSADTISSTKVPVSTVPPFLIDSANKPASRIRSQEVSNAVKQEEPEDKEVVIDDTGSSSLHQISEEDFTHDENRQLLLETNQASKRFLDVESQENTPPVKKQQVLSTNIESCSLTQLVVRLHSIAASRNTELAEHNQRLSAIYEQEQETLQAIRRKLAV